jgi:hypothetical protein
MATILRGRVSQLVRRETPTGVVQEFWVTGATRSGLVTALAPAGTGLHEGEVVEVEGVLDANGVLCAARVTRETSPGLPAWLQAPRRWLLTSVPVTAWAAITVVFATTMEDTVMTDSGVLLFGDRVVPGACVAWIAAGIALGVFARKRLRAPVLRALLQVTAAAVVLAALGLLLDESIHMDDAVATLLVVSVVAAIVAVVLERYVRARAS